MTGRDCGRLNWTRGRLGLRCTCGRVSWIRGRLDIPSRTVRDCGRRNWTRGRLGLRCSCGRVSWRRGRLVCRCSCGRVSSVHCSWSSGRLAHHDRFLIERTTGCGPQLVPVQCVELFLQFGSRCTLRHCSLRCVLSFSLSCLMGCCRLYCVRYYVSVGFGSGRSFHEGFIGDRRRHVRFLRRDVRFCEHATTVVAAATADYLHMGSGHGQRRV